MVKSEKHFKALVGYDFKQLKELYPKLQLYYYTFYSRKKNPQTGVVKKRRIDPSKKVLRDIQNRLKTKILSKIPFPDYIHGSVKGKSNISNAKTHKGNKHKFVTDLKKFFPNIKPKQVYTALVQLGFSPDISHHITKLTTINGSVPQGAPTSSYIANIVFLAQDQKIADYCSQQGIKYSRYVDDLSFSGIKDFRKHTPKIMKIIQEGGFLVQWKKTMYKNGPLEMTGVLVGKQLDVTQNFKIKLANPSLFSPNQVSGHLNYFQQVQMANEG